jgi:hypothetical protein
MKLEDYFSAVAPLTTSNFIRLRGNRHRSFDDYQAFDSFCTRMNEKGGYDALERR